MQTRPSKVVRGGFGHAGRADVGAVARGGGQSQEPLGASAGDTVVLSARIIPGNEKGIYRMINHFAKRGADVIYGTMNPPVHVSGHGSAEELRLVLNLVRPRYFRADSRRVPADGEARLAGAASARARAWKRRSCSKPARRWRSIKQGARRGEKVHGGPRVHRFRDHRRSGGGHRHSRPPASFRRRLRAADHRHQQAHREERDAAGNREPRVHVAGGWHRICCRKPGRWWRGRWNRRARKSAPIGA